MSTSVHREQIRDDGLRYIKKRAEFGSKPPTFGKKCCYVCMKPQSETNGLLAVVLGKKEYFCSPDCHGKIFKSKAPVR